MVPSNLNIKQNEEIIVIRFMGAPQALSETELWRSIKWQVCKSSFITQKVNWLAQDSKKKLLTFPLKVESESLLFGLKTASTMGIKHLEVEGDSLEVITAMKENLKECPSEIRLIVEDSKPFKL